MNFRSLPKTKFGIRLPEEVVVEFEVLAQRSRMDRVELLTRILSRHLGVDVADFGLDPSVGVPEPSHAHA